MPSNGVITSFTHFAEPVPDATLALVVMRPGPGSYTLVGQSTAQTLTGGALNTFATRIPVQSNDLIGVLGDTSALAAATSTGNAGDVFIAADVPGLTPGTVIPSATFATYIGYVLDIAATVEPDVDADGYGDETQDKCTVNATRQDACPPTLTFSYKKSQKTKSALALKFTSNLAASASVSAKVKAGKKTYKLKGTSISVAANTAASIKLKLKSSIKKAIKRAGKGTATVIVSATQQGSAPAKKTLKIKLKP